MAHRETAAPPEPVLPYSALPSQPNIAPLTPAENSPRVSIAPPQSVSSEYTRGASSPPSATSESPRGTIGRWSQFSLPTRDSDSEGESNGLEDQRERNLTTSLDERRSFPTPEIRDENDERGSFPITAFPRTGIASLASTENLERRSFPEQDRNLRDDRRSFPATILQDTNVLWPASIHHSDRQSTPFRDWDMSDGRRSFPTTDLGRGNNLSQASPDNLQRRSFPQPELAGPEQINDDGVRQSPMLGSQFSPTGDLAERRSFPALGLPGIELRRGRRSFPASELYDAYNAVETLARLTNREANAKRDGQTVFVFEECNGMTKKKKLTHNMEQYLKEREGWSMMVLKQGILKSIRFDRIVDHMRRSDKEAGQRRYFLIARHYVERFRIRYVDSLRPVVEMAMRPEE